MAGRELGDVVIRDYQSMFLHLFFPFVYLPPSLFSSMSTVDRDTDTTTADAIMDECIHAGQVTRIGLGSRSDPGDDIR